MMRPVPCGRIRAAGIIVAALLGVAGTGAAQDSTVKPAARPSADAFAWASITYLSGPSVYIDAGTKAGLVEGSRLEVVRSGVTIAELVVAYVSSTRASCTVSRSTGPVTVGDSVRYRPAKPAAVATTAGQPNGTTARARSWSSPIRGRVGVRYLMADFGPATGSSLTQPAFDLRLDGQQLGGTPIGLVVDVRANRARTVHASTDGTSPVTTQSLTRVYQAAIQWSRNGAPMRAALGRQFSTAISAIGLFDGASLDYDRRHWSTGVLGGSQPDENDFGFSTDVREYGAYVQAHNAPNATSLWTFTTGGVGSYAGGQIDREFVYLQSTFTRRWLSWYATQELDVNRGWKADAEQSSTTPTATYATLRVTPIDALSFNVGADSRRQVRLYRNFVTPEVEFDDSIRRGIWGGAFLSLFGRVQLSADARSSRDDTAGETDSYTGSFAIARLTRLGLGARTRATWFTGPLVSGQLRSASVEVNPAGWLRLEVSGGQRLDDHALAGDSTSTMRWFGADMDLGIGRQVYLMLSTYRETGPADRSTQTYASLSYRF